MIYKGNFTQTEDVTIAIVASRFNTLIVEKLIMGAKEALDMHGIAEKILMLYGYLALLKYH